MKMEYTSEETEFLVKVACATIRARLSGASAPPMVVPVTKNILLPAGCFVSLHSKQTHALRGCMGRIDSSAPLLMAVGNVSWQVVGDPRFTQQPVLLGELPLLTVEISILGLLKPAASPIDFEPVEDGIFLTASSRSGVFLPQVARQTGWSREQLLDRLCQEKLGVPPKTWQNPGARLFKFQTITVGPVDFVFEDLPAPPKVPPAAVAAN